MTKNVSARILFALLVGLIFLLPHLVRMSQIGSVSNYTPFAPQSLSPTTWDETFLYGPQANYMLSRHALANDTDTWEHRNEPSPYSVLPMGVEAAIGSITGGIVPAQIISTFLFPTLTAWLLIGVFKRAGATMTLSAALALLVLALAFSPRTLLLDDLALLRHGLHGGAINTLQGSRNPNPNMSFPLYLGSVICLCAGLHRRSLWTLAMAGVLGGLLFYTYIFYAIGWTGAVLLLAAIAVVYPLAVTRRVLLTMLTTAGVAVPFLWWKHQSELVGAYQNRVSRLGIVYGHMATKHGLLLTLFWGAVAVVGWAIWCRMRPVLAPNLQRETGVVAGVIAICIFGGILGMNMQVVTGFNIQADDHFPHMILQPMAVSLFCLLAAAASSRVQFRYGALAFAMIFTACAAAQVESGASSASFHRMPEADRSLFAWLNNHSAPGAVVATTDLRLCTVLPLYTHNGTLLANGTRSLANNAELTERYLLASKLTGLPTEMLKMQLLQADATGKPSPGSFLFEDADQRKSLLDTALPQLLEQYRSLNLPVELSRYRVDYIWMKNGPPAQLPAGRWNVIFENPEGSLWSLNKQAP